MRALLLMVTTLLVSCQPAPTNLTPLPAVSGYALVNGLWYDDGEFHRRALYIVDGKFTEVRPLTVDSVVDLAGAWVVPPFGDAHTHNLDGPRGLDAVVGAYVGEGTLYVQVLTNSQRRAAAVRDRFNRPGALDVAYAQGGITATLSHPFQAYEPFALGLFTPDEWRTNDARIRASRTLENDAYWFIDSLADLDEKWPDYLAGSPDLVKIYLLNAQAREGREGDWRDGPGLRPELVPEIVRRALASGLRVASHVETAADADIAIRAGATILAHLPGYSLDKGSDPRPYILREETAALAARNGVAVMPNAGLVELLTRDDALHREEVLAVVRQNIEILRRHGVTLVVGSDIYGRTALPELHALRNLGYWTNTELLEMWAVTTPRSIFPGRRIGRLAPGYEASLLALACDPTVDLACVERITIRIKQGRSIEPMADR